MILNFFFLHDDDTLVLFQENEHRTSICTNNKSASDNISESKESIPNNSSPNQGKEVQQPNEGNETKDSFTGDTATTLVDSTRIKNEEIEVIKSKEENKLKSFFNSMHITKQTTPKHSNKTTEIPKVHSILSF